jgi:SAM-dependent methyltransferase
LPEELGYWDLYLGTRGFHWPEDFQSRLDPLAPFVSELHPYLEEVPGDTARILDVGAGALTRVGKIHPTKRLEIIATDPLAPQYDRLLAKHGIIPPVRTIAAAAEELTDHFPSNHFDLATAFNCLDHSYDPLQAIREMIAVLKPSRCAFLSHSENEAVKQKWVGLHQWNFTVVNGEFLVRNRRTSINLNRELRGEAMVQILSGLETWRKLDGWIEVLIRKLPLWQATSKGRYRTPQSRRSRMQSSPAR